MGRFDHGKDYDEVPLSPSEEEEQAALTGLELEEQEPLKAVHDDEPSPHNKASLRSVRPNLCILLLIACGIVAVTHSRSKMKSDSSSLLHVPPFLIKTPTPKIPESKSLREANCQDRPHQLLGTKEAGFVHTEEQSAPFRHEQMWHLQHVRYGEHCKDFEKWQQAETSSEYIHANNAYEYEDFLYRKGAYTTHKVNRYFCETPHPAEQNVQVRLERVGPFHSKGNGDWSYYTNYETKGDFDWNEYEHNDGLLMREQLRKGDLFVRGVFISFTDESGGFIGYPPLHMHHAHLHPHADGKETLEHLRPKWKDGSSSSSSRNVGIVGGGSAFMDHHIMGQMHGDSICHDPVTGQDDFSCLLHILPAGHGMRVSNSSGFRLDFEVNDVRMPSSDTNEELEPLEEMEWYVEVAILWTTTPQVPVTFLHIAAPESGYGPSTYTVPLDDSTSMIYYNYTHDWRDDVDWLDSVDGVERLAAGENGVEGLGAGTISNAIGHAHQSMFDSMLVFKDTNRSRKVFEAIDTLRPKDQLLPYIPECHGDTLESVKDRAIQLALGPGHGELVCEVTKPALAWLETPTANVAGHVETSDSAPRHPSYAYRDRRMDLHCLKNIRIEPGDTLIFLSFSRSRPSSTAGRITRGSFAHKNAGVFEEGLFAQSEHTILRMDFVSDKARALYSNSHVQAGSSKLRGSTTEGLLAKQVAEEARKNLYAPPSMYVTQRWVHAAPDEGCHHARLGEEWFSFINKGLDWNFTELQGCELPEGVVTDRMKSMMERCPASIRLDGSS